MVDSIFSVDVIVIGFSVTMGGMCVAMVILDVLWVVGETVEIMLGLSIVATLSVDEVTWGLEVDHVNNHGCMDLLVGSSDLSV